MAYDHRSALEELNKFRKFQNKKKATSNTDLKCTVSNAEGLPDLKKRCKSIELPRLRPKKVRSRRSKFTQKVANKSSMMTNDTSAEESIEKVAEYMIEYFSSYVRLGGLAHQLPGSTRESSSACRTEQAFKKNHLKKSTVRPNGSQAGSEKFRLRRTTVVSIRKFIITNR